MHEIDDLINCIGDFHYHYQDRIISLAGLLKRVGNIIVLECRIEKTPVPKMNATQTFQVWGHVRGVKITLLRCWVSSSSVFGSDVAFFVFDPSDIIIGRECSKEIFVSKMSASIDALNYVFSTPSIAMPSNFAKDAPALLNYTFPKKIEATDEDGKISIYQGFQPNCSFDKMTFHLLPYIEYSFHAPVPLGRAIAKIASARNLFSFFADYYLPLENIAFADEESQCLCKEILPDCTLYQNHTEEILSPQHRFLIMTNAFCDSFQDVWTKWNQFYDSNKYIPTLFYEIICNRSTGINRFLNLTQAIEVFSYFYRNDEAAAVGKTHDPKQKKVMLKFRMEEIFQYISPYLPIESEKLSSLAKEISDARNFLTHFNPEKSAPSFQQICAANRLLRFVLLAIIYKTVGISENNIKNCMSISLEYSSLKRDIMVVLKEQSDITYDSYFD